MDDTYVPIFRSLLNHRYMADAEKLQFWIWCLLKASHQDRKVLVGNQTVTLEVGQFIFGRQKAAQELGSTEKKIRRLLEFFSSKNEQKLAIKTTNKFSVITVIDYASYAETAKEKGQQKGQQRANKGPAQGHKQEGKEGKEVKPYGQNDAAFDSFWAAYPRKVNKAAAKKAWEKAAKEKDVPSKIHAALIWQVVSPDWKKEGGKFIPHPSTYLNNRRWEDEPPKTADVHPINPKWSIKVAL